jgi:uncharacterized protein YkwD
MKVRFHAIGLLTVTALASLVTGPLDAREPSIVIAARPVIETSSPEMSVISQTNAQRARHGMGPLAVDSQLMGSASRHAQWMASNRNLSHGHGVAENIAMGQPSAGEAVRSWMNSSGHRANILGSGYTRIGVAVAYSSNGTPYWCQQFR